MMMCMRGTTWEMQRSMSPIKWPIIGITHRRQGDLCWQNLAARESRVVLPLGQCCRDLVAPVAPVVVVAVAAVAIVAVDLAGLVPTAIGLVLRLASPALVAAAAATWAQGEWALDPA